MFKNNDSINNHKVLSNSPSNIRKNNNKLNIEINNNNNNNNRYYTDCDGTDE